jgi:hypothetical protein
MCTDEEISACQQWLSQAAHRDFKKWATAKVDTPKDWFDLELVIGTVLQLKQKRGSQSSKNAYQNIWAKNQAAKRRHNTASDNRHIGVQTAEKMLEESTLNWRDEALEWARFAFTALAPRMNALAKKQQNVLGRREVSVYNNAKTVDFARPTMPTKSPNTTVTTATDGMMDSALQLKTLVPAIPNTVTPTEIQKSRQVTLRPASGEDMRNLPHKLPFAFQRLLCNRNILVRLHHTLAEKFDAASFVVVGLSAIVEDGAQEQHHRDIRCRDLSWKKFKHQLEESDQVYRLDEERMLFWDESSHSTGGMTRTVEIVNEAEFRCAVGLLEWQARQNPTTGLITPLLMEIREVSHN